MIENHGYVGETHQIITDDGYILTYYRIPHGINDDGTTQKPAALLVHGVTASSADFVAMGPDRSLAYILADAGYDVWLANTRGTAFSRNHTTLDPDVDTEEFYNFSWHETGYYDLPKAIDYILELKGDDSLHYVGHSQGTTAFFVLASTRPEYNQKIKLASLMAGAAIVKHYPNILIQELCKYIDRVALLLNRYKIYEYPLVKEMRDFVSTTCADPSSNEICDYIYNMKFSGDGFRVEEEFLPVIYTNNPSNTGMKQYVHFAQQVRDGGFRYFDYGTEANLELYGSESPPDYDLSKISAPVAFYYAINDGLITVEDEQKLMSMVPNVVHDYLISYDLFKHGDFLYANDVVELVYKELINVMMTY
ncbi:hypothetical protein Zmor_010135 [Zophobas morio]|uniref:Partial AB-hydrolase lipase domain-containing protein n=2 Tax=Zophobas morio TaxID=2755281 RepID=A0AA38IK15_9CUCU|nr:hypothetical protein Zmor_010135 [Zophobas morio]